MSHGSSVGAQFVESVTYGGRRVDTRDRLRDAREYRAVWPEVRNVLEGEVDSAHDRTGFAQFEQFAALTVLSGHARIVRQRSVRALPGR